MRCLFPLTLRGPDVVGASLWAEDPWKFAEEEGQPKRVPCPAGSPTCLPGLCVLCRREVYRILQEEGIDLPRYAVLNRDPDKPDGEWPAGS